MRDHPYHDTSVLGGLWGVKFQKQSVREKFNSAFNRLLLDPLVNATRAMHGPDQAALTKYFWYEGHIYVINPLDLAIKIR